MSALQTLIRRLTPNSENAPKSSDVFRVKIGPKIYGPVRIDEFKRIPGFMLGSLVAPYGTEDWQPAYKAIDLEKYFNYAPKNSFKHVDLPQPKQSPLAAIPNTILKGVYVTKTVGHKAYITTKRCMIASVVVAAVAGPAIWKYGTPSQKAFLSKLIRLTETKAQETVVAILNKALTSLEPKLG